jgi:hypothetical protein
MIKKIIYISVLILMLSVTSGCRLAGSIEHSGGFLTDEVQRLSK